VPCEEDRFHTRRLLDLNDVIDDVVPLIQREVMEIGSCCGWISRRRCPCASEIRVQRSSDHHLAINAIQAHDAGLRPPSPTGHSSQPTRGDDDVLIAVQDTGTGIEKGTADPLSRSLTPSPPDGMDYRSSGRSSNARRRVWVSGNDARRDLSVHTASSSESAGLTRAGRVPHLRGASAAPVDQSEGCTADQLQRLGNLVTPAVVCYSEPALLDICWTAAQRRGCRVTWSSVTTPFVTHRSRDRSMAAPGRFC